jgi:hypothetical protein
VLSRGREVDGGQQRDAGQNDQDSDNERQPEKRRHRGKNLGSSISRSMQRRRRSSRWFVKRLRDSHIDF